jgi:hypothetical protein
MKYAAEEEAALVRRRSGSRVLGVKAVLARKTRRPAPTISRSPAPLIHVATKAPAGCSTSSTPSS